MKRTRIFETISLSLSLILILTLAVMNPFVWGATSYLINYQGKLTIPDTQPLNGEYNIGFAIYNVATGGNPLWAESQSVTVVNGIFNVNLGIVEPLGIEIADYDSLYLQVKIGKEILSPRLPITSTVFAFKARIAEDTDALDGYDSSAFALSGHTHSFTDLSDTVIDEQIPDDITIEYAARAGNAVSFDGRDSDEFLDTSIKTQTKSGGLNIQGNVGIGTTKPQGLLQVGNGTFVVRPNNWVGIDDLDPDAKLEVSADGQSTPDLFMLSSNDNKDGDRFIVKNNGKVGIGTSLPEKELEVYTYTGKAAMRLHTTSLVSPDIKVDLTAHSSPTPIDSNPTFSIRVNDIPYFLIFGDNSVNINDGTIVIPKNRVGINDIYPSARLEVSADGESATDLFMLSSDDNRNGDRFIVKNNGRVGIGTNVPGKTLEVRALTEASVRLRSESVLHNTYVDLISYTTDTPNGSTGFFINLNDINRFAIYPYGQVNINGDLSVGTVRSSEELYVEGDIYAGGSLISGSTVCIDGKTNTIYYKDVPVMPGVGWNLWFKGGDTASPGQSYILFQNGLFTNDYGLQVWMHEFRNHNDVLISAYDQMYGNYIATTDPGTTDQLKRPVGQGLAIVGGPHVAPFPRFVVNTDEMFLGYCIMAGNGISGSGGNGKGHLYASGNIGIGTRTPGGRLDVGNGKFIVKNNGNVGIGTTDQFGNGEGVLSFKNAETVPSMPLIDSAALYASDGELYAYDSSGNATQISPHDSETGEWVFFSKNIKTGRVVKINMEKLVKEIERLTGKRFMEEWIEEN